MVYLLINMQSSHKYSSASRRGVVERPKEPNFLDKRILLPHLFGALASLSVPSHCTTFSSSSALRASCWSRRWCSRTPRTPHTPPPVRLPLPLHCKNALFSLCLPCLARLQLPDWLLLHFAFAIFSHCTFVTCFQPKFACNLAKIWLTREILNLTQIGSNFRNKFQCLLFTILQNQKFRQQEWSILPLRHKNPDHFCISQIWSTEFIQNF